MGTFQQATALAALTSTSFALLRAQSLQHLARRDGRVAELISVVEEQREWFALRGVKHTPIRNLE